MRLYDFNSDEQITIIHAIDRIMNKLSDNKSVSIDPLINESLHSINKEIQGIAEEEEISERALVYLSQSINDEMLVMLNIQRKIRALLEKKIFPNE